MKRYYFDYASSTPVDKEVLKAMTPYFSEKFGNAGSLHSFGQEAMSAVDRSRETVAKILGVEFRQIIFTGSATEANNLAVKGVFLAAKEYFSKNNIAGKPKIIVSAIEHESVLESARALAGEGADVVILPVDKNGRVEEEALRNSLDERAVLVSIMHGNNEIGAVQPIAKFAKIISEFKAGRSVPPDGKNDSTFYIPSFRFYPLFHADAAQTFQYLDCRPELLGVDLMTISSQKIYGPKGAGALYVRNQESRTKSHGPGKSLVPGSQFLTPLIRGGNQEFGMRSGTENVPALVGFAKAVQIAEKLRKSEAKRVSALKKYFISETKKAVKDVYINGPVSGGLPHIANIYFKGTKGEELLTYLDMAGFAVSAGSACKSRSAEPSHVVLAIGYDADRARESVRISFGRQTKKADLDKLIKQIKKFKNGKQK